MNQFLVSLMPALSTALLSALTGLITLGLRWVALKIKSEKTRGAEKVIYKIDDVARQVVRLLKVTVTDELKKAAADGKLTKDEITRVRDLALEKCKLFLTAQGVKEASAVLGMGGAVLDQYLMAVIESAYADARR